MKTYKGSDPVVNLMYRMNIELEILNHDGVTWVDRAAKKQPPSDYPQATYRVKRSKQQ